MTALALATFMRLTFTAPADSTDPGRVAAYQGSRSNDGGRTWTATTLWRDSAGSGVAVPHMPGVRDTVWVSVSTDRNTLLKGGTLFQVRASDVHGNLARWSNRCALAYFDTTCGFWRGPGALPVQSADLIGPELRVSLAPGDTALAEFVHFEYVQAEDAERILEIEPRGIPLRGRYYPSVAACWPAGKPRLVP